MNARLTGMTALLVATIAAVIVYPSIRGYATIEPPSVTPVTGGSVNQPRIEVVFVLDTTGSMDGLIAAAKDKIWSIATTLAQADAAPHITMGLVAYRDRGDAYVTQVVDLTEDLDSMYARLMDFQAAGGGDGPESVNQALYDAIHNISWSRNPDSYKVVFLVGDAPPHMDYQDDVKYMEVMAGAAQKGIVVNTIQCGDLPSTTSAWQHIAALGQGRYFRVGQAGSAVAVSTPFDDRIARLSAEIDSTRLYYGSAEVRQEKHDKMAATDKLHAAASIAARARRATFNASPSGVANLFGDQDLVDDVASGRVDLKAVPPQQLPETMAELSLAEQQEVIARTSARRAELQRRIRDLAGQRGAYIAGKVAELGGAADSLDHQVYEAVRTQAASKGLVYERGPEY